MWATRLCPRYVPHSTANADPVALINSALINSQWDLVCEHEMKRTAVQVALSVGKFLGAFLFGIVADK